MVLPSQILIDYGWMYKHTITLPNNPLYIFTSKEINEDSLDCIFELAKKLMLELNHNVLNSSAYIFNEAKVNKPSRVAPEFINFLEVNLVESFNHKVFKPFIPTPDTIGNNDPVKISEDMVVKLEDLSLNTSYLRVQFTLDLLVEFIKSQDISDFLIQYRDGYAAIGEPKTIFIELESGEKVELELFNEVTSFNYNADWQKDVKPKLKFAALDEILVPKYTITKNNNFINNKILSLYLHKLHMRGDFNMFVNEEKLDGLLVIDEYDKVHEFKPIRGK